MSDEFHYEVALYSTLPTYILVVHVCTNDTDVLFDCLKCSLHTDLQD